MILYQAIIVLASSLEALEAQHNPKPWKHRDKDKTKGVLSLAYIDKDLNFKLPEDTYQAGIIIKPDFEKNITVECASPMDMNTDSRITSYSNCLQSTEIKYSQIDYTVKSCQAWGLILLKNG